MKIEMIFNLNFNMQVYQRLKLIEYYRSNIFFKYIN